MEAKKLHHIACLIKLGFCAVVHYSDYYQQMEKIKLISWKLNSIWNENIEWHCMQLELNWIELIEAKSESNCLPNHVFDPWETKTTLINRFDAKTLYNLSSRVDVLGEISHPGNQKQSCCNRYKDFFLGKKWHIVITLWGMFLWIHHIYTVGSSMLPTYSMIPKLFYFPL